MGAGEEEGVAEASEMSSKRVYRYISCPLCQSKKVWQAGTHANNPIIVCKECSHCFTLHIVGKVFKKQDRVFIVDIV